MDNRACITCDRYIGCLDPKKSISYSCSKFIPVSLYGVGSKGKTEKQTIDAGFSLFDGHGLGTLATAKNPVAVLESLDQNYEFDLAKQVLDVVMSTDKALSKDLKVPDGDFPTAPNFYTFCTSAKYLKQTPYPWQILMPTIYLNEYCPRCTDQDYLFDTWKSTDSYLKIEKKVAFFEHGVCPHCKARRSKMVNKGLMYFYEEAALCLGQRSGKSANLGDVAAYLTHLEIKLQNVNEVYGLKSNSELHGTFVALTYGQAKDTLWDPYYNNLTDSPWFSSFHAMLNEVGGNHGEDLYRLKDSFVQYRHRKIKVYPAGPDKRVLRGRTRFLAAMDELGWFPNGADAIKLVKLNADEVYKALSNSLRTVRAAANLLVEKGFDNIPTAYFINLSSPASIRDKIMELVRKSQDSAKIFGIQLPTWDANPTMPRSMFDEEFNRDPVGAMRDFGAQPPISNSPLLSNLDSIEGCASKKGQNPIRIKYETKKGKNGASTRFAKIAKLQDGAPPSVLAIDAGYSNNSFACSIGHLIDNKRVKLDLMVEVQPLPGIPLNYTLIFKHLLTPLIQRRNVRIIAADRWNSIKLLQDAEEEFDIKHVIYSLKYRDMVMFKDYFESGQLRYPKPEWTTDQITGYNQSEYPQTFKNHPVEHFVLQCITVQDTGATVTKGDRLTDDLVRSSMLCLNQLLNEENQELLNSAPDSAVRSSVNLQSSIVMRTSSGASGSTPTGTVKSSSGRVIGTARARAF